MTETRRDLAVRAWSALLRSHAALVPEVDRSLQQAVGLPLGWYDVLLELAAAPEGRLRMSDLGERVVLSRTRVSRIVDELVAGGLVSRQNNPDDRRSAFASLTDAGVVRFRDAVPHYLSAIEDQFAARLTVAELRSISTALERSLPPTPVTLGRSRPNAGPRTPRRST